MLQGFLVEHAEPDGKVYIVRGTGYAGLPFDHDAVHRI